MLSEEKIKQYMDSFKQDCVNKSLSNQYIVQKYLCHGASLVISDDTLFILKHEISCNFGIHPNEVILTGSGKLGFSIAPDKQFRYFNEESDIDFAIISNNLFEKYWQELLEFNINNRSRTRREERIYFNFINYLFKGWIRPDKFPFNYDKKSQWFEFFNNLTSKIYPFGEHKITAGIYKNFKTFELYNIKNIERVRNELSVGGNV